MRVRSHLGLNSRLEGFNVVPNSVIFKAASDNAPCEPALHLDVSVHMPIALPGDRQPYHCIPAIHDPPGIGNPAIVGVGKGTVANSR